MKKLFTLSIFFLLLTIMIVNTYAVVENSAVRIDTLDQLIVWNNNLEAPSTIILNRNIEISRNFTLNKTGEKITINTSKYSFIIKNMVTFTINSPDIHIFNKDAPMQPLIVVKSGSKLIFDKSTIQSEKVSAIKNDGTAIIRSGAILTLNYPYSIVNSQYSNLECWSTAKMTGSIFYGKIDNIECDDDEIILLSVQEILPTFCNIDELPTFPQQVYVSTNDGLKQIGVRWFNEKLDTSKTGRYTVNGEFKLEDLKKFNCSNPSNIKPQITVIIRKPGNISDWKVKEISTSHDRNSVFKISLPALPDDVQELYIQTSKDNKTWEYRNYLVPETQTCEKNFVKNYFTWNERSFLNFELDNLTIPTYARVILVGSVYQGTSSVLQIKNFNDDTSNISVGNESDAYWDYEDFSGNLDSLIGGFFQEIPQEINPKNNNTNQKHNSDTEKNLKFPSISEIYVIENLTNKSTKDNNNRSFVSSSIVDIKKSSNMIIISLLISLIGIITMIIKLHLERKKYLDEYSQESKFTNI